MYPHAEHRFDHPAALAAALAAHVALRLKRALAQRGQAVLAVSGGKSPIALFERLREQSLDWAHVTVLLVDERCVPHQPAPHADSNTALVRQHLLQGPAASARLVPFFDSLPAQALTPDTAEGLAALNALAAQASTRVAALGHIDIAVLGMGEDGHTASLFPGAQGLTHALTAAGPVAWVCPTTAPHTRLSLTLPALQRVGECALSISGETKRVVYQEACLVTHTVLPVSLLLNPLIAVQGFGTGPTVANAPRMVLSVWLA